VLASRRWWRQIELQGSKSSSRVANRALGRANRPPAEWIELRPNGSGGGARDPKAGHGGRGRGARVGRTSAHARRGEARPLVCPEVARNRRESSRGGGGEFSTALAMGGAVGKKRLVTPLGGAWGESANHRIGAPFSTCGRRGRRGQVGGVDTVVGWDWGSTGMCFFLSTPTFRVGAQVGRLLELL
jgi:hypothetical protein